MSLSVIRFANSCVCLCVSLSINRSLSTPASPTASYLLPFPPQPPLLHDFTGHPLFVPTRFLLGDAYGRLFCLVITREGEADAGDDTGGQDVVSLDLEPLGTTSCASTITYLDSNVVFVGSSFGDSQLIRLLTERSEGDGEDGGEGGDGSFVHVLETHPNLGPIVDLCVVDVEGQGGGQGQVVTCSGAMKDGSLRIVRNGIGINEQASIELEGIKGMWALRPSFAGSNDKYLVQSYIGETRILAIQDDEMEETEFGKMFPVLVCCLVLPRV